MLHHIEKAIGADGGPLAGDLDDKVAFTGLKSALEGRRCRLVEGGILRLE
jgi:hypothetical protein